MVEIWKENEEYPDYLISNLGRIKSLKFKQEKILKLNKYSNGYVFVHITNKKGERKYCLIHRLVLSTFKPIDNMENYQVNHLDCNRENNSLDNLEWVTPQQNREYREKLHHTPKSQKILVQFLDDREDMIFNTMTECAKYFGLTRKGISRYLETQNISKARKIQAHFYKIE